MKLVDSPIIEGTVGLRQSTVLSKDSSTITDTIINTINGYDYELRAINKKVSRQPILSDL